MIKDQPASTRAAARGGSSVPRVPRATYRLQFSPDFSFAVARDVIPYLRALGASEVYASPLFAARAGSSHGYDVADYRRISEVLGGAESFETFSDALRERDMGLVLDMVPNHMGIGSDNPWWIDVLENGQSSEYAEFFDIDWQPLKPEMAGKVLLPILGDQYGVTLEKGELQLTYAEGALFLSYYETRLPLAPRTYTQVLTAALEELTGQLGEDEPDMQEYLSIITALRNLPARGERDPELLAERRREKEVVKRRLAALTEANQVIRRALEGALRRLNGTPGNPRSFDALHELIDMQPYRPAFWRVAAEEINYRRFFDINDLAAVRVEIPEAFEAMHELVMRLAAEGRVSGLRIDHPDGLWDPPAYFRQLQERYLAELTTGQGPGSTDERRAPESLTNGGDASGNGAAVGGRPSVAGAPPLYVVAEKILSEREPLPEDWAVAGTTGYDFLNAVNGLFVNRRAERALDRIYRRFVSPEDPAAPPRFEDLVHDSKQLIMDSSLASELRSLVHRLERVNEKNRRYRDFTIGGLTRALTDVVAGMSIYRTYITGPESVSDRDRKYITAAVREARRRHPRTASPLFSFIEDTLLLRNLREFRPEDREEVINFVMRFQQITGPIMAKSVEDTAFYIFNRLVSLNEVGGAPEHFGTTAAEFHRQNAERARSWPNAMLSTATHDTKRGEDVRARINVLSELPEEWEAALARWGELGAPLKQEVDGEAAPDRNDEYLLYQTVLGAWPEELQIGEKSNRQSFRERIAAYMQKATKEAKVHTSWINPNERYDEAMRAFVEALLADGPDNPFLPDALPLARRLAYFGRINGLAQTLLKLASPGVPDIYQGTELWDLSLVDPDNRRPVDFAQRAELLRELRRRATETTDRVALAAELLETWADGRIKLFLVAEALELRQRRTRLFAAGEYLPLEATGEQSDHVCAFARLDGAEAVLAVAPRLVAGLTGGEERLPTGAVWGETRLRLPFEQSGVTYRDVLTGALLTVTEGESGPQLALSELLAQLPVALLERAEG
jgi:(1->4)-alpha-D-glucan 1-alpha-D-glucosylmutase